MMTIYNYFKEITSDTIVVLGEKEEQWTKMVSIFLVNNEMDFKFFSWAEVIDLRLQLELTCYPVTQLWISGNLEVEVVGYQSELLRDLVVLFLNKSKRSKNVRPI